MVLGGERAAVQNPILAYAQQVGWQYIRPDDAQRLRGGREGRILRDVFFRQVQRLNPGFMDQVLAEELIKVIEVLDQLMDQERRAKEAAAVDTKLRFSGIPVRKTLDEFDFSFQPSIDQKVIKDLFTLRFLHNTENVVFLGPPGVGKTHLAVALGVAAIEAGHAVRFVNATRLVEKLKDASRKDMLEAKLVNFRKYPLVIIDEIGYLPFDDEGAHCFFQLVSQRYERGSLILTSNKSFGEWGEVFQDNVIASAVLDRILHHCTALSIRGESYRLKNREKYGLPPRRRGRPRKSESGWL